jgi:hypothetical protein
LSTQYSTVRDYLFIIKLKKTFFYSSSEGSSSPVPRAEAVINRTNEPIAQPVSNTSLQHVQAYPTTTIDTSANDNIDHYHHHQSPNDM